MNLSDVTFPVRINRLDFELLSGHEIHPHFLIEQFLRERLERVSHTRTLEVAQNLLDQRPATPTEEENATIGLCETAIRDFGARERLRTITRDTISYPAGWDFLLSELMDAVDQSGETVYASRITVAQDAGLIVFWEKPPKTDALKEAVRLAISASLTTCWDCSNPGVKKAFPFGAWAMVSCAFHEDRIRRRHHPRAWSTLRRR